jgi:short-subunit dehydrogenase
MKKVLIVGATSGIGRELALRMAAEGWTVATTGRREGIPGLCHARFDITADEHLVRAVQETDGIDMLVYCAGTGDLNPGLDADIEARTNAVNVDAFVHVMTWGYNYFAARGSGHIAAVTSVAGLRGGGAAPAYGASKAYQINFLEALCQRSGKAKNGVAVTDLRPGSVDTAMMKGEGHFWISTPRSAAAAMLRALKKRRRVAYITPRWCIAGTIMKLIPRSMLVR